MSRSNILPDRNNTGVAWQPLDEVTSSSYNLVLSVPGEAKPVLLAVSRDAYFSNNQAEARGPWGDK